MLRIRCGRVFLTIAAVALLGRLCAAERVALELGGYRLGSYYQDNEEQTEPGPMKLKRKVFNCDRVYVRYDINSRLAWCRFEPPPRASTAKEASSEEVQALANELIKRYPFLVKSEDHGFHIRLSNSNNASWHVGVEIQKCGSGVSLEMSENLSNTPLPQIRKPTTPITNLFGVALGSVISNVNVQVKHLEEETLGCQYRFTPVKQFRTLNNYYLKVKDGVVVGIYGVAVNPKGIKNSADGTIKEKKNIAALFTQKFGARFLWGDSRQAGCCYWSYAPKASRRETICSDKWPYYRGIGDDFTSVFIKEGEAIIEGRRRVCLCVALETSLRQKSEYERLSGIRQSEEKMKKSLEKKREADLDAL